MRLPLQFARTLVVLLSVLMLSVCSDGRRGGGGGGAGDGDGDGDGGGGGGGGGISDCEPGAIRCEGARVMTCRDDGHAWLGGDVCALTGQVCVEGRGCVEPNEAPAEGEGEGGPGEGEGEGGPGEGEGEGGPGEGEGEGGPGEGEGEGGGGCQRGEYSCRGSERWYCLEEGQWEPLVDCADTDQACEDGECVGCTPGETACVGQTVMECDAEGHRMEIQQVCAQGTQCVDGECVQTCGVGGDGKASYQGCEYWAVDLDNADVEPSPGAISPASAQFAVVVSNVNRDPVTVTVYRSDDGRDEVEVVEREIAGNALEVIDLPARAQEGSGKGYKAYRVAATQAVIAYQFNPLNNTEAAYSNDASLLIPSNALGTDYIAVAGDALTGGDMIEQWEWGSYVTVVGVAEEPTEVTVVGATAISPPRGGGVEVNGNEVTTMLHRYEVLSVHSRPPAFGETRRGQANMSGTRITSSAPVAVFSGNVAAKMPVDGPCCADHLEEQMWPVSVWGRRYLAARSLIRKQDGSPETDFWRVTGSVDGTRLTYHPRAPQGAPQTIDAGQSVEFESASHFAVTASEPVLLTQFLAAAGWVEDNGPGFAICLAEGEAGDRECTRQLGYLAACISYEDPFFGRQHACGAISDPSMVLVPPTEQFREEYVFLTPLDYQTDFINVIAPSGAQVTLDGDPIPNNAWDDVGQLADGDSWRIATLEVSDGRHTLSADMGVGLLVYGYDKDVSYGYPGGLNLEELGRGDGR